MQKLKPKKKPTKILKKATRTQNQNEHKVYIFKIEMRNVHIVCDAHL